MSPPRLAPVVITSAAVAAVTTAYVLGVYLPSYNTPRTPMEGVAHAPRASAPRPALARRLVLAITDGLSFDLARELPELARLRAAGALRMLVPPFPTYTSPALVTFVTGLDPLDHGIRLNGELTGAVGLDTLTAALDDARVPTRLRSREWKPFEGLMYPTRAGGPPPSTRVSSGRVHFLWSMWARAAGLDPVAPRDGRSPARAVELVYFGEVDEAGHRHGGASAAYVRAAHHVGSLVEKLASTLDLAEDAIVVVSDHAHRAAGGHGGVEPEVQRAVLLAAGRGVRRGAALPPRPTRDVAPTLAALAGVRAPASSLGRPMLDVLDLDGPDRALSLAAPFEDAGRLACRLHPSTRCVKIDDLALRLGRGDSAAVPEAEALLDAVAAERAAAAEARAVAGRRTRLGVGGLVLLGAVVALWVRRRSELVAAARQLPLAVVHATLYAATLWFIGYRPSLSAMKGENYNRDTFLAATLAATASLVVTVIARPPPIAPWSVLVGVAAPVALLAAWVGADHAGLPPPVEGAVLFEIAPLVLSAAALSAAMRLAARRLGPRPNGDPGTEP